jgi:hypothetical protein
MLSSQISCSLVARPRFLAESDFGIFGRGPFEEVAILRAQVLVEKRQRIGNDDRVAAPPIQLVFIRRDGEHEIAKVAVLGFGYGDFVPIVGRMFDHGTIPHFGLGNVFV